MRIIVLVKQVPDTWEERALDAATGRIVRDRRHAVLDEISERALEVALRAKDAHPRDVHVVAVTMGPESARDALSRALAMGADDATHIAADELRDADIAVTAAVLASALRTLGFDLVIAGDQSTDGASGLVPAMIAAHLGTPALTALDDVRIAPESVSGTRTDAVAELELTAPLPALVSVTERVADARFPGVIAVMKAKRKPIRTVGIDDLTGVDLASRTWVRETAPTVARSAATIIVDEGEAGDELADFLLRATRR